MTKKIDISGSPRRNHTRSEILQAQMMYADGESIATIAAMFHVNRSTISRWVKSDQRLLVATRKVEEAHLKKIAETNAKIKFNKIEELEKLQEKAIKRALDLIDEEDDIDKITRLLKMLHDIKEENSNNQSTTSLVSKLMSISKIQKEKYQDAQIVEEIE